MDWIKRNLYFVIGSAVALVLMGLAGFFLYSKWSLNEETMGKLNQDYSDMDNLNAQKPHPGAGSVDNIKAAREQQQQVRAFLETARKNFQRIPPIPDVPKLTDQEVSAALSRTIAQSQAEATNASVSLPANYNFSFEAQKSRISFAAGSLEPLAVQLGEIKAICDVLFQAKINSLDNVRRERVSTDDYGTSASVADYVPDKSVTNELAVLTPYEVTMRCFSSELAAVLAGFASSPYAFLVKTINVEPATTAIVDVNAPVAAANPVTPVYIPTPATPAAPMAAPEAEASAAAFARRYGLGPGRGAEGGAVPSGGVPLRPMGTPAPTPTYYPQAVAPGMAAAAKGGLPTVLEERQLKITMNVIVVKLLPVPAKPAK